MQLPSLNALRAVEAIGRHRSLTQAARALGVTPGALSHQLRALEERLGLALFVRSERGLVPTAAGQRLLPALTDAFQRIADAIADATARGQSTLTVTCGLAFAAKWLVPRLVEWSSLHSDLEVRLVTTSRLVDFDREDIDLGIRFGRGRWPELRSELVVAQMLFPVCTPDLARQLRSPADLAHVPLIDDARSLFGWDQWLAQMGHYRGSGVRRFLSGCVARGRSSPRQPRRAARMAFDRRGRLDIGPIGQAVPRHARRGAWLLDRIHTCTLAAAERAAISELAVERRFAGSVRNGCDGIGHDIGCHSFCLSGYLHDAECDCFHRRVRPILAERNRGWMKP